MSLPDEKALDLIDGLLAEAQERLDAVHRCTDRIGTTRLLAARTDDDAVRAKAEHALGEQEHALLLALDGLAYHGQIVEEWASKAWCAIKGEKKWHREVD